MAGRKNKSYRGVSSGWQLNEAEDEQPESRLNLFIASARRYVGNPIAVLGVFAVAYLVIGYMYYQARNEEADLQSRIEANQLMLARPAAPAGLESSLNGWQAALEQADDLRVKPKVDSSLLAGILEAADESGATLVSAGLQSDEVQQIDDSAYRATPIQVRVTGTLESIRDFIGLLEEGAVEALEVRNTLVQADSSGNTSIISAVIYSQPDELKASASPTTTAGDATSQDGGQ